MFARPQGGPRYSFVTSVCVLLPSFGSVLVDLSKDEGVFVLRCYHSRYCTVLSVVRVNCYCPPDSLSLSFFLFSFSFLSLSISSLFPFLIFPSLLFFPAFIWLPTWKPHPPTCLHSYRSGTTRLLVLLSLYTYY